MRDMPRAQTRYPMNLAETASIFFETVVGDRLVEMAATPEEKLEYAWYDAESAAAEEGAPGEGGGDDAAAGTLGPEGGLLGPEPELGAAKSKVVEL